MVNFEEIFLDFESEIYLANIYIVPEGSAYIGYNEFHLLYDQVLNVPNECGIILCGDLNARTGVMPDFDVNCAGSNGDLDELLPGGQVNSSHMMEKMVSSNVLLRFSQDKATTNRHGTLLIELCLSANLLIFNGRLG